MTRDPGKRTYRHVGGDELSPRQVQALGHIAVGAPDAEIASMLFIGESTVRRHVRDILSKLGARNRAHAVHIAHRRGLLS